MSATHADGGQRGRLSVVTPAYNEAENLAALHARLVATVPATNEVGQGHKIAFNIVNIGRFKLGAGAVGAAKDCLQVALDYAKERHQFGWPIASFGMIQRKLADMATRIYDDCSQTSWRATSFAHIFFGSVLSICTSRSVPLRPRQELLRPWLPADSAPSFSGRAYAACCALGISGVKGRHGFDLLGHFA